MPRAWEGGTEGRLVAVVSEGKPTEFLAAKRREKEIGATVESPSRVVSEKFSKKTDHGKWFGDEA
jgi:hypothetical protein